MARAWQEFRAVKHITITLAMILATLVRIIRRLKIIAAPGQLNVALLVVQNRE